MKYRRHKWSVQSGNRTKDSSSSSCTQCGMVRQYVGGIVTYYDRRTEAVHDRYVPKCESTVKELAETEIISEPDYLP